METWKGHILSCNQSLITLEGAVIREEEVKATPLCSRMCNSRENVSIDVWDVLRWMNSGRAVGEMLHITLEYWNVLWRARQQ